MLTAKASVHVERPLADVFRYMEDQENRFHWQPGLVSHVHEPLRVGAKLTEVRNLLGRRLEIKGVITAYERDRGWSFKGAGPVVKSVVYHNRFEREGEGTRIDVEAEYEGGRIFGLAQPALQRIVEREIQSSLEHLKDMLEAHQDIHLAIALLPPHEHRRAHPKKEAAKAR
ncbi:MAG TPA: SRPBCC family protein [Candidatus Acidoferrales bacterium]|nr:SRPBCC family protein [Candidatus Acidoferrales bacterium]